MKTLKKKIKVIQTALTNTEIKTVELGKENWSVAHPFWNWMTFDYRVKPVNKQVPYDFSDAENLIGRKFKHKRTYNIFLSTYINSTNIYFGHFSYTFSSVAEELEIWNNTLNRWESCTKTVKG